MEDLDVGMAVGVQRSEAKILDVPPNPGPHVFTKYGLSLLVSWLFCCPENADTCIHTHMYTYMYLDVDMNL